MATARTHRRVMTLAIIAALLIGALWLKPNSRTASPYVGKWTIKNQPGLATWPIPVVEFNPDGTGTWWASNVPQNRTFSPSPLHWRISGDRLIWRREYESLGAAMVREIDLFGDRFWNRQAVAPHECVFRTVSVAQGEIEVDVVAPGKQRFRCVLRRSE